MKFDQKHQCNTYLCNFVHDSYLWEIPVISTDQAKQYEFIQEFIKDMREALAFDVGVLKGIKYFPKLKLDFKIGINYQDMIYEAQWLQLGERQAVSFCATRKDIED